MVQIAIKHHLLS